MVKRMLHQVHALWVTKPILYTWHPPPCSHKQVFPHIHTNYNLIHTQDVCSPLHSPRPGDGGAGLRFIIWASTVAQRVLAFIQYPAPFHKQLMKEAARVYPFKPSLSMEIIILVIIRIMPGCVHLSTFEVISFVCNQSPMFPFTLNIINKGFCEQ